VGEHDRETSRRSGGGDSASRDAATEQGPSKQATSQNTEPRNVAGDRSRTDSTHSAEADGRPADAEPDAEPDDAEAEAPAADASADADPVSGPNSLPVITEDRLQAHAAAASSTPGAAPTDSVPGIEHGDDDLVR